MKMRREADLNRIAFRRTIPIYKIGSDTCQFPAS